MRDRFDQVLRLELGYLRMVWRYKSQARGLRARGDAADESFWLEQLSGVFCRREEALAKLEGE